ncbi:MAG: TolC family protein, partial [Flavobacteriaceae bacterium]|nr:TolC family protein [Flavobacteriaceae bacterium]
LDDMVIKDKLQKQISKSILVNNVRRLYWSIVAVNEKIKITNRLHSTAKKQAAVARRRKANSVSDKAEVARFESLVHQRKGSILALEYNRELLFKNLRDVIPFLNAKNLKLANYDIGKINSTVLACSGQVAQEKFVPYKHTRYDEVTKLLRKIQRRQMKIDKSYDMVDLAFELKVKRTGVASEAAGGEFYGDYQQALDDIDGNDRSGMSAGFKLTIPFGENKKTTADVKKIRTEKEFTSDIWKLETNIKSTHTQVQNSVKLLAHVISEQKLNSKQLSIRVREMKKKYAQARVPEYALIQDEDSLLQSDLSIIDTQLLVINTLLDYLSVFDTYPCMFNRI